MKKLILLPFIIMALDGFSQADTSVVRFTNPPSLSKPNGYTHAVHVDLGNCKMIIISGQVALDKVGNIVGPGDFTKQAEQVFLNIKAIVEEAGGTMNDLVKISNYFLDMSHIPAFREVRNKYINLANPPASTSVQVSKLFREGILLEVEATAIIAKKH